MQTIMQKVALLLACLACSSHEWRVQPFFEGLSNRAPLTADETVGNRHAPLSKLAGAVNPTSAFNPSGPGAPSHAHARRKSVAAPAVAQQHVEAPVTAHEASMPRQVPAPVMQATDTDLQPSVLEMEPTSRSPAQKAASALPTSKAPVQSSANKAQSSTMWWSKVLGVRWALFAGLAAMFSKSSFMQRAGQRSGRVLASGDDERDPSLIDERDFTEEERTFFQSRTLKPSKREIYLNGGWGSLLLVGGTVASLWLANSSFSSSYVSFWDKVVGYGPKAWHLQMTLRDWVNEAIMAFFFFLVGMEIKREVLFGSLASLKKAALPCIAALGGMLAPAAVYCGVQVATGNPLTGWAIPMATDIAFAMGVYNAFRTRMPAGAAAFLLTLATVDDLGAIAVIAVAFAKNIHVLFLGCAGLMCLACEILRRQRCRNSKPWLAVGVALWYSLLRSGVNADVAGVVVGCFIPTIAAPKWTKAQGGLPNLLDHYIHCWTGWANFLIMPLFAIANTAVVLSGSAADVVKSPISQGIMAGLLLGKPLGIAGVSLLSLKMGWCSWPTGMKPIHLLICGLLGGIAFTMSLFLIEQSLTGGAVMFAKLAVIAGSTLAALISLGMMRMRPEQSQAEGTVQASAPAIAAA